MIKKLLIAISTIAAMLALASTSNAATSTVRLHTQGDVSKFLADPGVGVTSMMRNDSNDSKVDQDRHRLGLRDLPERQVP